jgi:hypothetical protein
MRPETQVTIAHDVADALSELRSGDSWAKSLSDLSGQTMSVAAADQRLREAFRARHSDRIGEAIETVTVARIGALIGASWLDGQRLTAYAHDPMSPDPMEHHERRRQQEHSDRQRRDDDGGRYRGREL